MLRARPSATALAIAAAIALAACGGDDDDDGGGSADKPANTSSMQCLVLSTYSPEQYPAGATEEDGVEGGVKPLLTSGAKGGEILTGSPDGPGAVVIEYPDEAAATAAHHKAQKSKELAEYVDPKRVKLIEKTLFIDYRAEPELRRTVEACATDPAEPPPAA